MAIDLENYVDVRQRIQMFREKYPNGSLQPADPTKPYTIETIGDKTFIVYVAAAYRTPDDPRPGIGSAFEPIPGRTPYTRDSELMNAETSAWGRAIVAVLAVDHLPAVASAEEVRNRQEQPLRVVASGDFAEVGGRTPLPKKNTPVSAPKQASNGNKPASENQKNFVRSILGKLELTEDEAKQMCGETVSGLSMTTAKKLLDDLLAVQRGTATLKFHDDGSITVIHQEGK